MSRVIICGATGSLGRYVLRQAIGGTRLDSQEALDLESINEIFSRMRAGDIQGRILIDFRK